MQSYNQFSLRFPCFLSFLYVSVSLPRDDTSMEEHFKAISAGLAGTPLPLVVNGKSHEQSWFGKLGVAILSETPDFK